MATDLEINYAINAAEGQTTLRSINKELKNLISLQGQVAAGSANFKKLQDAINKTEGKLGDLTDSFRTLRGSGVERLNSSIGLFREGLLNADTEKLKIGLQGVGSAMKAIPIFLLVEGITLLIQNFDKVTAFFKSLTGGFTEQERAVRALNNEYDRQIKINNQLALNLENETKLLKAKQVPLEKILEIEQKTYAAKLRSIEADIAKEELNKKQIASNTSLLDTFTALFGAYTNNTALLLKGTEDTVNKLGEAQKKIDDLRNKSATTEVDKEVNKIDTLNKIRDREKAAQAERIKRVQELIEAREKLEEGFRETNDRLDREAHEKEIAEIAAQIEKEKILRQEEKDWILALEEGMARDLEELNKRKAEKKLLDEKNSLASELAARKFTTSERISDVENRMKIELANEQLTMDQRVAIIKKGEADILAIKTASLTQGLQIASQYAGILSAINDIQVQRDNQRLREQEYAKNAAIEEDNRRAQEAIDRETAATNTILNNDAISAEQKARIKYDSESRIMGIEKQSKNTQIKIEDEFRKQQTKIKKAQFEKEKTLRLVNIAIDTASALVKTTAELGGVGALTPGGIAILGGITALGVAQAAIVADQKFDEGPATTPPSIDVDTRGGFSGGGPSGSSPTPTPFNPNAIVNKQGSQKVGVLESDIRETMQKVEVLESRATFGV
jgi:hypothetical protein